MVAKKRRKKKQAKQIPKGSRGRDRKYTPIELFIAFLGAAILVLLAGIVLTSIFTE